MEHMHMHCLMVLLIAYMKFLISLVPHKEIVFGVNPDLCGGKHWGIPGLCPDTE